MGHPRGGKGGGEKSSTGEQKLSLATLIRMSYRKRQKREVSKSRPERGEGGDRPCTTREFTDQRPS